MRALAVMLTLLAARVAPADEDDPKAAREEVRTYSDVEPAPLPDEDDPKLARGAQVRSKFLVIKHVVPRVDLAYRRFTTAGLEGNSLDFNSIELDFYPVSNFIRFGLDTEGGVGTAYSAWYLTVGASLGLQYPWRVTPFVEGRFTAGLIGATFMGQSAVSYLYVGGLEAGADMYIYSRLHLTAALGWAHPVFSGIDVDYVKAHPMLDPQRKDFAADTFTFKIGLGL
jgi:hypothetical protein